MGHPVPGRVRLVAEGGQRAADLLILAAQLLMLLLQLVIGFQRVAGLRVDVQIEHQLIQREVNCLYAGKQVLAGLVIPIAPAAGANGVGSALGAATATGTNGISSALCVASATGTNSVGPALGAATATGTNSVGPALGAATATGTNGVCVAITTASATGANGVCVALSGASTAGTYGVCVALVIMTSGGACAGLSGHIQRRAVGASAPTKAAHAPEGGRAPRCAASATGLITPVRGCDAVATTASPRHCAAAAS